MNAAATSIAHWSGYSGPELAGGPHDRERDGDELHGRLQLAPDRGPHDGAVGGDRAAQAQDEDLAADDEERDPRATRGRPRPARPARRRRGACRPSCRGTSRASVVCFHRRASRPSKKSVAAASANSTAPTHVGVLHPVAGQHQRHHDGHQRDAQVRDALQEGVGPSVRRAHEVERNSGPRGARVRPRRRAARARRPRRAAERAPIASARASTRLGRAHGALHERRSPAPTSRARGRRGRAAAASRPGRPPSRRTRRPTALRRRRPRT